MLIIFVPILAQNYEYNKILTLLNGILLLFFAIFVSYLIFSTFTNIKLEKGKIKQIIFRFFVLVFLYHFITLIISIGIFGTISVFLPEKVSELFPEYEIYMVPTLSLSLLFLYRIFGLLEMELKLPLPPMILSNTILISSKEMRRFLVDFIVGLLIMSMIAMFFFGAGIYTISKYVLELNLFVLTSSFVVASIELSIWYLKNYFSDGIKDIRNNQALFFEPNEDLENKIKNFVQKIPKSISILSLVVLFAVIILFSPSQSDNSPICCNTTVLEVNISEMAIKSTKITINEKSAKIPLLLVDGKQKPLTDRTEYLINNNIFSHEFINKSLKVSTENSF